MPYVEQAARQGPPIAAGELTYELQQVLNKYLVRRKQLANIHYQDLGNCLLALEGCKADFIERILRPYESRKNLENGEVWDDLLLKEIRGEPR